MIDIGTLAAKIEADTSGLRKSEQHITSFAKKAAASLAGIVSAAKVAEGIKRVTLAAARYDTLGVVMENVGKKAGYSTEELKKHEEAVRKSGISMTKTREVITRMAQAEIDLSKSTELARVAQNAAVIGNINSSDAFARMIRGIQSGELEILKTIGINANFQASYAEMAAQLGKTAGELTNYEKTQARVNSVLKEGAKILGTYEASMNTPMKKLLSMSRYVEDIGVKLGHLFTPAFGTMIDEATTGLKNFDKSLDPDTIDAWGKGIDEAVKILIELEDQVLEVASTTVKTFSSGLIGNAISGAFKAGFKNLKSVAGGLKDVLDPSVPKEYIDSWASAGHRAADAVAASTKRQANSLKTLEKKYKQHVSAITGLSKEIQANLEQGAQTIRDIQREGMSDAAAQRDLKKEADEYAAASEKALAAWRAIGEAKTDQEKIAKETAFEDIIRYADTAQAKYLEMDRTSANTRAEVIKNVQEMIALRDEALTSARKVETDAANALIKESDFTLAKTYFESIKKQTNEISTVSYPAMGAAFKEVWNGGEESANIVFTNIAEQAKATGVLIDENLWAVEKGKATAIIEEINKVGDTYKGIGATAISESKKVKNAQVKDTEVVQKEIKLIGGVWTNVYDEAVSQSNSATNKMLSNIKKVADAASKVSYGSSSSGSTRGYRLGGYIQKLREGGRVIKAQMGRYFPGYGGGDKIDIKGEAGEFMLRKEATKAAGVDTASAYNRQDWGTVVRNLTDQFNLSGQLSFAGATGTSQNTNDSMKPRNYYIEGEDEPIRVNTDNKNATRLFQALVARNKRRS